MWCHWCRKVSHTDAQCFSTRPADWQPKPEDSEPTPRSRELEQLLRMSSSDAVRRLLRPPAQPNWLAMTLMRDDPPAPWKVYQLSDPV